MGVGGVTVSSSGPRHPWEAPQPVTPRKPLPTGGDGAEKSPPRPHHRASTPRPRRQRQVLQRAVVEHGVLMAMEGYRGFLGLLVSALLVGFLSVIFVLIWVLHFREGLGWDGGALEFNWHPVLAVTGFVFIQGIAIIVYRLPWTWKCSKLLMKSIHAGLNAVAAILAIISVVAVFEYHNVRKIPHMYSLHSWVGLTALILYIQQLVVGFFVFLLPWAPLSLRAIVMPIHVYSGLLLFGTVIATVLMGVTEKLFFVLKNPSYHSFPPEGVFTNTLGLLILVFGALIFWIVTRPQWKRPREPGSIPLQLNGGGNSDGMEGAVAISSAHSMDPADAELSSEGAARKRTLGLADNGQRSTM